MTPSAKVPTRALPLLVRYLNGPSLASENGISLRTSAKAARTVATKALALALMPLIMVSIIAWPTPTSMPGTERTKDTIP